MSNWMKTFMGEQVAAPYKCDLSKKPPSKFGTSRQILKEYYT